MPTPDSPHPVLVDNDADGAAPFLSDAARCAVFAAVKRGDAAALRTLLDATPAALEAEEDETTYTPLLAAAAAGQASIVSLLLERRANTAATTLWAGVAPDKSSMSGSNALHLACTNEAGAACIPLLVAARPSLLWASTALHTPLAVARLFCAPAAAAAVARETEARVAEVLAQTNDVFVAVRHGKPANVERLLASTPTALEAREPVTCFTPLMAAADAGRDVMVRLLLASGANTEAFTTWHPLGKMTNVCLAGSTALHLACRSDAGARIVPLLVAASPSLLAVKTTTVPPLTPRELAARMGAAAAASLEAVELAEAAPDAPLFAAVRAGNAGAVKKHLAARPSSLEAREPLTQFTPLIAAAAAGRPKIVSLLLGKGARVCATTPWHAPDNSCWSGSNALHMACRSDASASCIPLLVAALPSLLDSLTNTKPPFDAAKIAAHFKAGQCAAALAKADAGANPHKCARAELEAALAAGAAVHKAAAAAVPERKGDEASDNLHPPLWFSSRLWVDTVDARDAAARIDRAVNRARELGAADKKALNGAAAAAKGLRAAAKDTDAVRYDAVVACTPAAAALRGTLGAHRAAAGSGDAAAVRALGAARRKVAAVAAAAAVALEFWDFEPGACPHFLLAQCLADALDRIRDALAVRSRRFVCSARTRRQLSRRARRRRSFSRP